MNKWITVLAILFMPFSYADNPVDFFSLTIENDSFYQDDGLYSNGFIARWGYDDLAALDTQILPDWLAYLAQKSYLTKQQDKQYAVSYSVAHLLQTAINIKESRLIKEDAPYVGLLAWESELMRYDPFHTDRLSLVLGVVGPIAGGEAMQKIVHGVIGANTPLGWDNQIKNEPVLRLQSEKLWRVYHKNFTKGEFDLLTGGRAGIGNLRSDIGGGIGLRWGQDLQDSFFSSSAFPLQKLNGAGHSGAGWYFFINSSAFYVANDIFIDGNTFTDSHSVDLIHLQYGGALGFVAQVADWEITYTILQLSDQYYHQNERSRFGSITISYDF